MKNEDKVKEIANDLADCAKGKMNKLYVSTAAYAAAMKMYKWKDSLPLSELDGWSTDEPTEEGFYLVETDNFPKDCRYVVARWYSDNHEFYDEAFEETITYNRWKRI